MPQGNAAWGRACRREVMPSYRRCASAETCALSAAISRPASSAAAPKPTASGAGTVPLRRPRSCAPSTVTIKDFKIYKLAAEHRRVGSM